LPRTCWGRADLAAIQVLLGYADLGADWHLAAVVTPHLDKTSIADVLQRDQMTTDRVEGTTYS